MTVYLVTISTPLGREQFEQRPNAIFAARDDQEAQAVQERLTLLSPGLLWQFKKLCSLQALTDGEIVTFPEGEQQAVKV